MKLIPLIAAGVLLLDVAAARTADLTVVVKAIANDAGHVLVAVCTPETFLGPKCPYVGKTPAASGEVTVAVQGIQPGTYAVQAFHDENDNLDIDRTLIGFPKEGMGFSNDAPMRFGAPSFADAAITLPTTGTTIRLRMRYLGAERSGRER